MTTADFETTVRTSIEPTDFPNISAHLGDMDTV